MTRTINITTLALAFAWCFIVPTRWGVDNMTVSYCSLGRWPVASVYFGTRIFDRGVGEKRVWLEWNNSRTVVTRFVVVAVVALLVLGLGRSIARRLTPSSRRLCGFFVLAAYAGLTWAMVRQFIDFYAW